MAWRSRWARALIGTAGIVALGMAAAGVWLVANGRDLVWSAVLPDHAALLEGDEVPAELPASSWAADLAYLEQELPRRFVRFAAAVDAQAFAAELDAAAGLLPELGRAGRILQVMRVMALPVQGGGAGHTSVSPLQRPLDWGLYPFHAYLFDDGVWVTLAGAGAEAALGAEVLAVGGRPTPELLDELAPYLSADNASQLKDRLGQALSFAGFLRGSGAAEADGAAELTLRRDGGTPFTLRVEPVALASLGGLRWGRTIQRPVDAWSPADPRPRKRNYDFEYREADRLVYLQLNRVRNQPDGESIAEFTERLARFAAERPIEKFVIDLRANGGGNNQLVRPLVELLSGHPEIDRRGVLYVLVGRRTYSAAGGFAAALERRTRARFAGEPSGFTPNHYGDAVTLPLPHSRVLVQISTRYWEDGGPDDRRPWIEPHLAVPFTHADHFGGVDPVLAAVRADAPDPMPQVSLTDAGRARLESSAGRYRFDPYRKAQLLLEPGGAVLTVDGVGRYVDTSLHALRADGASFATHLPGVRIELDDTGGELTLDVRGERRVLLRMPPDERLPIELVRAGEGGDPEALAAGVAAFRQLAAAGVVPDSRTEFELNRVGYALLRADRAVDAVAVFELQAELYPEVANGFDSLGDGYRALDRRDEALAAYRTALELDPGFAHAEQMLAELEP